MSNRHPRELAADMAIIGGGVGGCAAAWAALRQGRTVVMTEETAWIGGQLTSQAVPPDEHPWIEQFGCTRSYRRFREAVRQYYRDHYPLTSTARCHPALNPGNGSVSRLCHEPRVALAVLQSFLLPFEAAGRLILLTRHCPHAVDVDADRVRAVTVTGPDGERRTIVASHFLDATELGDLLPLAGAEYVTGAEAQADTGEPHAAPEPQPDNEQAITWCFAVDYLEGEDHTIDRPEDYDYWRDYTPGLTPPYGSRLLEWTSPQPATLEPVHRHFDPLNPNPGVGCVDFWVYRRIVDRSNFEPGFHRSDVCLINWPQNDYFAGRIIDVTAEERERHLRGARQLSLSLLYWMQTESPRPDGGTGWPGLRLRGDVTGGPEGLAPAPYIRESRRMKTEFTVLEQHVGTEARMEITGLPRDQVTAESFPDSVGIGSYRIDLHPSTGGDNYIDISCLPFQIPLGALIPVRLENLLPACKNLGVTHITNGTYRLHPVEWNIGEAAGLLAAFALDRKTAPRAVRNDEALLTDFQRLLAAHGFELDWPRVAAR